MERSHRRQGPWQNWLRDIDQTFTATPPHGRAWNYRQGNPGVWWTAGRFDGWQEADRLRDWVRRQDDLPRIEDLLTVRSPGDGIRWLNGNSYFAWKQEPPVGRKLFEVERGEVAYWIRGGPRNSDSLLRWDPDPGEGVWHATEETELPC